MNSLVFFAANEIFIGWNLTLHLFYIFHRTMKN